MNETTTPELDREAFQRVWRKVMPENRVDCPFTVEKPASVPAQGIQQYGQMPAQEVQAPNQMPVQGVQQSGQMPVPAQPPTPVHAPVSTPMQPALSIPAQAVQPGLCLGDGSLGEVPALVRFLGLTLELEKVYRALGRNQSRARQRERFLTRLAGEKRRQSQRLAAAGFLISGRRPQAVPAQTIAAQGFQLILRECYRAEQRLALALFGAANGTVDPCLMELYRELGGQNQTFAGQIRELLEGM